MSYVEDPLSRIVGVHWADDDGDDGGGGEYPDPCGAFYFPSAAPFDGFSHWFMGVYQPYMIGYAGYAYDENGRRPYNTILPVGDHDDATSATAQYDLYYWGGGVHGWKVTLAVTPSDDPDHKDYSPIGIDVYYNLLAQDLTINTPPDLTLTGEGSVDLLIDPRQGSVIFGCWGGDPLDVSNPKHYFGGTTPLRSAPNSTSLTIQADCDHAYFDQPPPQPPGHGWDPHTTYPSSPPDPRQPGVPPANPFTALRRPRTRPRLWRPRLLMPRPVLG
jgi:hypothetical protein